MKQQNLKSLRPDDDLAAILIVSEQIEALGYGDIRHWLLDELKDDLKDIEDGVLSIRALRFVLKTLKVMKYEREKKVKNENRPRTS